MQNVLSVVSFIFLPVMTHKFLLHDATMTMLCFTSQFLCIIVTLLARDPDVLYVAASLGMLNVLTSTPIRSWLSKIVGPDDVGKVSEIS